jgi:hypothetical protein
LNGRLTLSGFCLFTDIAVGLSSATVVSQGDEDVISGPLMADYPVQEFPARSSAPTAAENPAHSPAS